MWAYYDQEGTVKTSARECIKHINVCTPGGSLCRFGLGNELPSLLKLRAMICGTDRTREVKWIVVPMLGGHRDDPLFGDGLDAAAVDPRLTLRTLSLSESGGDRAKQKSFWCDKWHPAKNILDHLLVKVINVRLI